jgi:hypothetical protein
MGPEQAFLEQLLHAHQAEDAFWHEAEDDDEGPDETSEPQQNG